MREIEIRAWDKKNKRMIPSVGFRDTDCGRLILFPMPMAFCGMSESEIQQFSHGYPLYEPTGKKNFELMEVTGLKDKNGKKIYEGDVVRYPHVGGHYDCVVDYQTRNCDSGIYFCGFSVWDNDSREVIGNIYENPELIKSST